MSETVCERARQYVEQECAGRIRYTLMEKCLLHWNWFEAYIQDSGNGHNTGGTLGYAFKQPESAIDFLVNRNTYNASYRQLFNHDDGGWCMEAGGVSDVVTTAFAVRMSVRENVFTDGIKKSVEFILSKCYVNNGWQGIIGEEPLESSYSLMVMIFEALALSRRYEVLLRKQDRAMLEGLADILDGIMRKHKDETHPLQCLRPSVVALYVCGLNHLNYGDTQTWVTWLKEHQNTDGGWGDAESNRSELLPTCYAIIALKGYAMERLADPDVLLTAISVDAEGVVEMDHDDDLQVTWNEGNNNVIQISVLDHHGECVLSDKSMVDSSPSCSLSSLTERDYEVVIACWTQNFEKLRGECTFMLTIKPWHTLEQMEFHGWNANGVFYAGRHLTLSPLFAIHCSGNEAAEGLLTCTICDANDRLVYSFESVKIAVPAGYVSQGISFPELSVIFDKAGVYTLKATFAVGSETHETLVSFTVHEPRTLIYENMLEPHLMQSEKASAKVILNVSVWNPGSEDSVPVSFAEATIKELYGDVKKICIDKLVNDHGQLILDGRLIVQAETGSCSGGQTLDQYGTILTLHAITDGKCEFLYRPSSSDYSTGALLKLHSGQMEGQELHLGSHIGNVFVPFSGRDTCFEDAPF